MTKLVLTIVAERWCDAKINSSHSTTEINLYKPSININLFKEVHYLYTDELIQNHQIHIDKVLEKTKSDIYLFSFLGNSFINPTPKCLSKLNGKKIFFWPDIVWPWIYETVESVNDFADAHYISDIMDDKLSSIIKDKYVMGVMLDDTLFYREDNKVIDASFMGTQYYPRKEFLDHLIANNNFNANLNIGSGPREQNLSFNDYAKIMRRSLVGIHFPLSPSGRWQLKGRPFENMSCKTMVLEQDNPHTEQLLVKGIEYDTFKSKEELVDKVKYYTKNPDKASVIAERGYYNYISNLSTKVTWNKLLKKIYV